MSSKQIPYLDLRDKTPPKKTTYLDSVGAAINHYSELDFYIDPVPDIDDNSCVSGNPLIQSLVTLSNIIFNTSEPPSQEKLDEISKLRQEAIDTHNKWKYPADTSNVQMPADDLEVGGIELSLNNIDFNTLHGINFDAVNKTIVVLCESADENKENKAIVNDKDTILKTSKNQESVMVWQHFCAFCKMFNELGDRQSVSFSLDPADKINPNKSNQNVRMKKVYYPQHLRFSKAGEVMFDADLFIKTLLYDMHPNITKFIPNYHSYIEKTLANTPWDQSDKTNNKNGNWHRLWIVLDDMEMVEDVNSLLLEKIKFKINVRKMNVNADGGLDDDLSANEDNLLTEFITHINNNMDIVHHHCLFLQRLEGVFRALVMAKFVYKNQIPFNMNMIDRVCQQQKQQLISAGLNFEIPPLIKSVSKERKIHTSDAIVTQKRTREFSGGIDLNIIPKNMDDAKQNENVVKMESLNKVFNQINKSIFKVKNHLKTQCGKFQTLCNVKNKQGVTLKAILFPDVLFDSKIERICEYNECKEVISWQKQYTFQNHKYCLNHYNALRYAVCIKCKQKVDRMNDKYKMMKSENDELFLHDACYVCFYCEKRCNQNRCIDTGNGLGLYCSNKCIQKANGMNEQNAIKQCMKCQKDINLFIETDIVEMRDGKVLHIQCLKCSVCGQSMNGEKIMMDSKNNIFCGDVCVKKCQLQKHKQMRSNSKNMVCHRCNSEILVLEQDFISMNSGITFHSECLRCYQCSVSLKNSNNEVVMDGNQNLFCSKKCAITYNQ
eukprot:358717_1